MGHCSIRSLLLAAIVISNCITWTASRHHYTHNVHGHRSRHRRQGAGLFLSSSYVIPGGEGSGAWGEWGEVSPCSRTCGGGVASQKRICLEVGPDGQSKCTGGDTKYFSCETQDCPDGSQDFRAQQCSEYDHVAFKGIKYTWVPYTKGPKPCELNCMPRGERFYYRQNDKVIDGTRCYDDSFDVCVDGMCQPVGCDFMLGSSAREDKCRECRGNGTNCKTYSAINTDEFRNGYNDILLIPEGATSIVIAEVKSSSNYLAIRAMNNTYYLNGDYKINFPRSIDIAGAKWYYERSQDGLFSPDKLRSLGPTNEPLYLSLLLQEPNVGIQYEYSIPNGVAPPTNREYRWVHDEFSPCSATCGGGFQTRNVTCRSREELEIQRDELCTEALRPAANQTCNTDPCPPTWVEGPWGSCSKLCGKGGTRNRTVHCEKIMTIGYPSLVADKECFDLLGPKPPQFEECNQNATCPLWFTGPWKPCDKLCDEGKQTRQVVCYQKNGKKIEVLDDKQCEDEKPAAEQPCMLHPCEGVDWILSEWGGCDTCLSTVRTRTALCTTKDFKVVNDSVCAYHPKPVLEEPCNKSELPACEVQWYATQWSNCSAKCGKGVKTRRVFCGLFDGASVIKVEDSRCDPAQKYDDTKPCEIEKCPNIWYAGPWSECTAPCGGGEQYRRVTCLSGHEKALCSVDTVLDSTQSCNHEPCNEDETLPLTPNSTPIIDDEEYCDDEDYEEVGAEEDASLTTSSMVDEMFSDSPSTGTGFSEIETEFTDTGSGLETLTTEGSGFDSSDYTSSSEYSTETTESGSGGSSSISETDGTGTEPTVDKASATTDSGSSVSAESTVSKVDYSTISVSTDSTESTGTTESEATESTVSGGTEATELTESTISGATDSTESGKTEATELTESTISGATESTVSGGTEATVLTESTISGATESTVSGGTESLATDITEISTDSTGSTETASTSTEETVTEETATEETVTEETATEETVTEETVTEETATEDTVTEETVTEETVTEETVTEESTLSTSSDTGSTDDTTGTEYTDTSGSTEGTDGTTDTVTLSSSSGETESTESSGSTTVGLTEPSGSTESSLSTVSAESESTEETGSTQTTSERSSGSTEVSGSTDIPSSTENGSTATTESGATDASEDTVTTEIASTESSGSTESSESTESTESGSTTESGTEESGSTTEGGTTEPVTEETGSTVSETEGTDSTETDLSQGTTEDLSSVSGEETTASSGTTRYDWSSTIEPFTPARKCKRRKSKCAKSKFGCCPDKRTPAAGPFDEGCPTPKTCTESEFGCCPDGVSPALGPNNRDCPLESCAETLFGCCKSDNKTAAEGNEQEGCPPPPPPCKASKYGCCKDEKTEATGPKKQGCPETTTPMAPEASEDEDGTTTVAPGEADCNATEFGCCPDNVSPAAGLHMEGCIMSCNSSAYGCCEDGVTPAHGPGYEGCCLLTAFGCCPDNIKPAEGPHREGCGCQYTAYGCCPNNVTIATGPDNEGCGCEYTANGCCPDRHTPASGPKFAGCGCHTFQFGCCEDGVTTAMGPGMQGCYCQQSEFGCCGDEKTPAVGPDQAGCDCSNSKYGCCPDGETPAQGTKFLGCTDKPNIRQAACALSTDRGPCTNYTVFWYYDLQYGGCSRFWYGGCEGNGNRFTSKEECEDVCVNPAPKDACNLPMVKGACQGYHPRWFYDTQREHCSQFVFGGCLGNANNFDSRELCQKQCEPAKSDDQCSMPIDQGSCAGNYLRWGWNPETDRCEQFIWGGCEGNNNRFSSEAACLHRCNPPGEPKPQCAQPQEAGNCTEKQALWAFSSPENSCVPFYYSGCGGNENRFDSKAACAETCPSTFVKDMCTQPAETGECAEYTEKWYYDTAIKRCRQFYYGGCGGNQNRFSSQMECENQCSELTTTTVATTTTQQTTPGDICALPSALGECDNYVQKWFFDQSKNRCELFYYGGCGGNDNRFNSAEECAARCGLPATTARPRTAPPQEPAQQEVCFMSVDPGPCTERHNRWAYDAARGDCVQFSYGGCGGNQNNFPDQEYCQLACGASQDVCQLPMLTGSCDDSLMQWFYDPTSDSCSQFTYSGCGGNGNRFASHAECEQRCRAPAPAPPAPFNHTTTLAPGEELPASCRVLPEANEECDGEDVVFYYDEAQRACVPHSNAAAGSSCRRTGAFPSEEACERTCGAFRNIEVCRYPLDPGPCREAIPKFYFDEALGSCLNFNYGGCHGGPNRFSSIEECEDVCKFEKDPCKRTPKNIDCGDYLVAWFFDEARDECYQYGTCDHNDLNRFATQGECEGQCRRAPPGQHVEPATPAPAPAPQPNQECVTPTSFEGCSNATVRFYYDAERRQCVQSKHGDCGHANSYSSEEECERTCGVFRGIDPCRSPLDVGLCNSAIPKFYWKLSSGRCEQFAYSGCGGGANRFSSAEECQRVCSGTGPEPACLERVRSGSACAAVPSRRWYYSERAASCLPFVYLGCGGGRNNFLSPQACARACHTLDQSNEVLPDCDRFNEECEQLRCQFGMQRTRTADGCERCSCVPVEVDCAPLRQECDVLKCTYGIRKIVGDDGCERCTCYEHPCADKECPAGERCVTNPYRDPITQEVGYTADCRITNKPGTCPVDPFLVDETHCRRECNDDADCVGVGKCCARGCSRLCLEPATPTSPAPITTTFAPELPQAPQANPITEPEVTAQEGGTATLRCLFYGNPPPKITWRRGEITVDGDVGRYRLLSDGALEIVSLYRNDSGVYICVAENEHGISQQEVRLQVNDPEEMPAGISGEPNAVVTGEFGRSLNIRCLAYGYPSPSIYWYRGRTMLPYSSELYEARENVLQIRKLEVDTLGEYACQAFNGIGKPAVWSVEVRASSPEERWARTRTVDITPAPPRTQATTTLPPEIDMPVYTVAVHTKIPYEQLTLAVGSELSLPCEVDGYPLPEVSWTKDGARLGNDARTQTTDSRLTISGLRLEDTGEYGCQARNEYSSHSSAIHVTVQGVVIPVNCKDNPFFADCKLIVRSKFCKHQYYSKFCCESCVKAGQLDALSVNMQADEAYKRRK